jgi:ribosomal protein S18 acetylase RimI-like enzyme
LRLERGGAKFLAEAANLAAEWSTPVLSPAVLSHRQGLWSEAGYRTVARLLLFEHDLRHLRKPEHEVERIEPNDQLHVIDRAAFPPRWRMGRAGLAESLEATPRRVIYQVCDPQGVAGFAIAGVGLGIGYLQRLAVLPRAEGQGVGRSLVAAALGWARRRGAASVLVNTQEENARARALYERAGFRRAPQGLAVMAACGTDF